MSFLNVSLVQYFISKSSQLTTYFSLLPSVPKPSSTYLGDIQCWNTLIQEIATYETMILFLRTLAFCKSVSSANRVGTDSVQTYLRKTCTRFKIAFLHSTRALEVRKTTEVATSRSKSTFIAFSANIVCIPVTACLWVTTRT